ncbi:MAG: MFS transporter [Actinobacteria bacterium]|nr:MFS transporter [Actinomycetota bacterium]MBI3687344.1 MFS transporter [Actinomycetota bacterium]
MRAVLARPDFRRLLATRLAAQCADGVFQASLAGVVLFNPQRQADPASVAAGFAVLLLPYSVVGPFAGVLLDRWIRRRVLTWANVLRCGLVGLVAALTVAGVSGPAFFGSALAVISVNRFFLAALGAALPHVANPTQLVTANATATTGGSVATALGAVIALGLLATTGPTDTGYGMVALSATVGYAASALAARGFRLDQLGPDETERARRETPAEVIRGLLAGLRHVHHRRRVGHALAAIGGLRFWYGMTFVSAMLLYRNYFHDDGFFRAGPAGLGQAVLATALGSLLAAVATPPAVRRIGSERWITATLGTAAVTEIALGSLYTARTLLPAALLLGFVAQGTKICVDTIVQETVDDAFRGRVFSLYDTLFNAMFVAAAVVSAVTLPTSGKSYPMLYLSAGGYAVTALAYRVGARYRGAAPVDSTSVTSTGRPPPPARTP